jgi:hypothetical protein
MIRKLLSVSLLLWCFDVLAQTAIDASLLGTSESQLTNLFPATKRLPKPLMGPRGLRGSWRLDHTPMANLWLDTTFYVKAREVMRIEQQAVSQDPACQKSSYYAPLMADLQAKYGSGLASVDTGNAGSSDQSVVWTVNGNDVLVHVLRSPTQCSLLVIYQPNPGKDASAL